MASPEKENRLLSRSEQRSFSEQLKQELEVKAAEAEEAKVRRHAEIQAEVEIDKARQLAEIQTVGKIRWHGNDRELGALMIDLRDKGLVKADNLTALCRLACQHFCRKDGSAINDHSLYVNLRGKFEFDKKAPAEPASKPTKR